MEEAIRKFHTQFEWAPALVNASALPKRNKFVVGGMGGSHLSAGLLQCAHPTIDLLIHRDYGLPALSDAKERLYIASSYSGNTEETIDFAESALKKGYSVATMSTGGRLLELAQRNGLPHVIIPDTKIQPRSALGFGMKALGALLADDRLLTELSELSSRLFPEKLEEKGRELARALRDSVPIIYASTRNSAVAYNWKIKMNETGKLPAFYNVFPELNHNEMTGFDIIETTEGLSRKFHFLFLTDSGDHPQVAKRMKVTKKLYEERGFSVTAIHLDGKSSFEKICNSLLIADWTAVHLSRIYGTEAEQVPMVEEFKQLITHH